MTEFLPLAKSFNRSWSEILNNRVSQEHLVQFINENQVDVLLVKNATSIDHQVIDSCKSLKS
jgi:D-3-phosphoglycerate dehydrogenase